MSRPLPREILDLIVDHLHDDPKSLKACCAVSKAWIRRTRTYLFNRVEFPEPVAPHVTRWGVTFPDPLNSPAHHTRVLSIGLFGPITAAVADILLTFCNISHLNVGISPWYGRRLSLAPLHVFSPTVRSLHLNVSIFPVSEVLDLIRSFSLLEDLSLSFSSDRYTPPTSPTPPGSVELRLGRAEQYTIPHLLDLPNGLRFNKIAVQWTAVEDVALATDLVLRYSETLQSLVITSRQPGVFSLATIPHR
jgi:hypothetical protein